MNLFELTRKLIDIPSVTGDEKNVGDFLVSHLEELGYQVRRQTVAEGRFNIVATTSATASVVLSTHMDTVPPHIPSSEDEQRIFGRGACDAKGIIAAQIHAAQRLRDEGVEQVGLLFTVDEETGSEGARIANAESLSPQPHYLINGEPTDNKLASATKGSLRVIVKTKGRACHSAYPEQGESAIEKLLDILDALRETEWPEDEKLGETTCNIGVIAGGSRSNIVPDSASADLHLRLATNAANAKAILERAIAGRGEIEYLSAHDPVHLFTLDGIDQAVMRFTTDIPYLSNWGKPLLLGPGSILAAHTADEFVEKRELERAVDLYVQLIRALLGAHTAHGMDEVIEGAIK
jgi:acetylornithine deacetylase